MSEKLKPCPACGGEPWPIDEGEDYTWCRNRSCGLEGPRSDPDGRRWNALPRRDDPAPGMSDGELIARTIHNNLMLLTQVLCPPMAADKELCEIVGGDGRIVQDEFDRREALRKPKS